LYVWYQDVDSGQWVQASGGSSSGAVTVLTPELFGARGDGVTDDTASIQAAINAAGAAPCGDVYLAGKTYKISQTLDVPYPNVSIVGAGGDVHHTIAPQGAQASTKLKWAGAHGGTMMHIRSPEGASLQALTGGGVKGVYFDSGVVSGADGAGIGIRISSRRNGWYEDVFFRNFQDVGFLLDCVSSLGDDRGCHHNMFMLCGSRNTSDNMDGGFVRLYGDPGPVSGEPTNCNVYGNTFMSCRPVFITTATTTTSSVALPIAKPILSMRCLSQALSASPIPVSLPVRVMASSPAMPCSSLPTATRCQPHSPSTPAITSLRSTLIPSRFQRHWPIVSLECSSAPLAEASRAPTS
jgi:hypothetical protein